MSKLPNSNKDNDVKPTEERPPDMPRWVKVTLIIVVILVLLFVILKLFGIGGEHGPSRHRTGIEPAKQIEQKALGIDAPGNHTPPGGGH